MTRYQTQAGAFYLRYSGEYICRNCATRVAERGLENAYGMSAVTLDSLDEANGERTWDAAEMCVSAFERDHPDIAAAVLTKNERWSLVDRIAATLGDTYAERCRDCGDKLD